ncbi:transcription factor S [Methanosalsum natronophilum]|uniref:Transcription factor S n=1 Tax=Methanosalsum natronophilum TaxID=768733 RepID=A0A3R7VTF0_9EURY|nr:transcription factor S [Methanosalsum natronophilum]MCS3923713.1 DNA-directed RNA polymerase subunit M [Methanosalsum natronophilum]RQD85189.1 MAG: transcription factor S [Methanosalsum natronophilum]
MEFCPKCKSLMYPKEGEMSCKKCGYVKISETDKTELVSKTSRDNSDVTVLEEDTDIGLPTTNARCPECGHNLAYWWLRQLRSADESETRFFKCTKCQKTWREYD